MSSLIDEPWLILLASHIKGSHLDILHKVARKTSFDVQRYLSLGWMGVCEVLDDYQWDMMHLMNLWEDFSLILRLQHLPLESGKVLALWETVLYLVFLLFVSSEFPCRLRPPCTTMPWTIWPALVVLWGVCWMFYGEPANWADLDNLVTDGNWAELFVDLGSSVLSPGTFYPTFDTT